MTSSPISALRRSPANGGYARGEDTKKRVIDAAVNTFAEEGYTAASTRKIAARAGVSPPALQYYFDSKFGLHISCAELMAERLMAATAAERERGVAVLTARDASRATKAIGDLVEAMLKESWTIGNVTKWSLFSARLQDGVGPGLSVFRKVAADPLFELLLALVALEMGRGEEDPEVKLATLYLLQIPATFGPGRRTSPQVHDALAGPVDVDTVLSLAHRIIRSLLGSNVRD